jgi:hypothetical protein
VKQAGPKDLVMERLQRQLADGRKPEPGWKPPVPTSAVEAWSELWSFAELLGSNDQVPPEQLSPVGTEATQRMLQASWPRLSGAERGAVLSAPGLWASVRAVLRYGRPEQQAKVRGLLRELASPKPALPKPPPAKPAPSQAAAPRPVDAEALGRLERELKQAHPWAQRLLR